MPFAHSAHIRITSNVAVDVSVRLRLVVAPVPPAHEWDTLGHLKVSPLLPMACGMRPVSYGLRPMAYGRHVYTQVWRSGAYPTTRHTDFNYFGADGGWGHMVGITSVKNLGKEFYHPKP